MMVSVGMELEGQHFRHVAQRKGAVLLTLASQAVILPALGFGLAHAMALPPHINAGILLVAACPVGDIANFYVLLARGNLAFSVTMSTLSILLSAATMAVVFEAYDHLLGAQFVFALPTSTLLLCLTLMLALPVLAGMAIRRVRPRFVERHRRTLRYILLAGIVGLVAAIIVSQRARLATEWRQTATTASLFIILALLAGAVFSRLLRLSKQDSLTATIAFPARNVALAMAIAVTLLNRIDYAVFVVVFFLTEVPLLLGAVAIYLKWWAPVATGAGAPGNFQ